MFIRGQWGEENIKGGVTNKEERKKERSKRGEIFANPNCVYYLELSKHMEMNGTKQIRENI